MKLVFIIFGCILSSCTYAFLSTRLSTSIRNHHNKNNKYCESYLNCQSKADGELTTEALGRWILTHKNAMLNMKINDDNVIITAKQYFEMIENQDQSKMLINFCEKSSETIQKASYTTIFDIIGHLGHVADKIEFHTSYDHIFDVFYQLHMAGYCFKTAEYQMSLTKPLIG